MSCLSGMFVEACSDTLMLAVVDFESGDLLLAPSPVEAESSDSKADGPIASLSTEPCVDKAREFTNGITATCTGVTEV